MVSMDLSSRTADSGHVMLPELNMSAALKQGFGQKTKES